MLILFLFLTICYIISYR